MRGVDRLTAIQSPVQGFRYILEQGVQIVDESVLTLHLTPHRRVGAGPNGFAESPELCLARAFVTKDAVLVESGAVRSVGFVTGRNQHIAVEIEHLDGVAGTHLVDCRKVFPREESEGIDDFQVEKLQRILASWVDWGR